MKNLSLSVQINLLKFMPLKKKKKIIKTKTKSKKNSESGLTKFASLTTSSLSKAITNFKKNQEIKKIKEIKLKKLEENNQILKEKKELRIWEDKIQKERPVTFPKPNFLATRARSSAPTSMPTL